jgi:hypothetical protein
MGQVRARDYKNLASASEHVDVAQTDVRLYRSIRQLEALFKKNVAFTDETLASEAAWSSFYRAETLCRITNKRFAYQWLYPHRIDAGWSRDMDRMRSFISRTVGDVQRFLEKIPEDIRITSGATLDRPRKRATPPLKIERGMTVTRGAMYFYSAYLKSVGFKTAGRPKIVDCNRVTTVPKTWKTHRMIAAEPTGNVPFQLAFDAYVKRRLKHFWCIDLSNQKVNQEKARIGSIDGSWATIDMSMASDTIALEVVKALFPSRWFQVMDLLRSPVGLLPNGERLLYSKFSTMGNGTTFGIETLIFAAACFAAGADKHDFYVYGDDIVIRTEHDSRVRGILRSLGFKVNEEKSFASGPFRESCGGDFLNGVDVRPFYFKGKANSRGELSLLVNSLVEKALPMGKVWALLSQLVISEDLTCVPACLGSLDAGVHIDVHTCYEYKYLQSPRQPKHVGFQKPVLRKYRKVPLRGGKQPAAASDVQNYLYWQVSRSCDKTGPDPLAQAIVARLLEGPDSRLEYSTFSVFRYRTETVSFNPARGLDPFGTPAHIPMWSEYLVTRGLKKAKLVK